MGLTILTVLAVLILAVVVFVHRFERVMVSNPTAKWLLGVGLTLMALYAAFLLYFGLGEMFSGDFSGIIHLLPGILLAVLAFLSWRRPLEGGIVLALLGALASFYYAAVTMQGGRSFQPVSLVGGLPYLLAGLLFLGAALLSRKQKVAG